MKKLTCILIIVLAFTNNSFSAGTSSNSSGSSSSYTKAYNLVKAAEVTNLAITDWNKFKNRKYAGDNHNAIDDPANAKKNTHEMAFGLDVLMKIVTSVELASDLEYLSLRKKYMHQGIDELVGFNPHCIN